MHPLLQLLLLSVGITFAAGQQSFYSTNGQQNAPDNHFLSQSPNSHSLNGGFRQQVPYSSQGYSPQLPYGSNNPPTQQVYKTTSYNPVQAPAQSQQSYAYAPGTHSQPAYSQYGTVGQTYSNLQPAPTHQLQSTYQPVQYTSYSASPSASPYSHPQPLSNQPQQTSYVSPTIPQPQQNLFSQRQLGYHQPQPAHLYDSPPNIAMNPPPTTMSTSSSFGQPTPAGPGHTISSHQLMSRRGPFDGMINRAKEWVPSLKKNRAKGSGSYSPGMVEMNRLPKPPKYPLYDMAGMGLATPPPPPLMSPMSQLPTNIFSSFATPPGSSGIPQHGGRPTNSPSKAHPPRRVKGNNNNKRRRNRPPPPPPPPPPAPKFRNNKRQRLRVNGAPTKGRGGSSYSNKVPLTEGFDHPMASNVAVANSPPLGRPLGFDEYMKRPTHSFTDDPWNFDPNAQSYNEGMNTHAMKYNYDPLGTNALDTSVQSHLDISKMSYPGDIMNMDAMKEPAKPLHSQLGGWDLPPTVYRSGQPSPGGGSSNSQQSSSSFNRYDDHHRAEVPPRYDDNWSSTTSTTMRNGFSQYDSVTEASIVKSETLSPITLISGSDGAIEFDIDATLKGSSSNKNNNNNNNHNSNHNSNHNNNHNNNNNNNYDYKLSDHYSPNGDGHSAPQQNSNYDQYSSSNYNSYSQGNEYGSRYTRANAYKAQPQPSSTVKSVKSISSPLNEGMDLFHDFIKDPNPGLGKARARHHLYQALMS